MGVDVLLDSISDIAHALKDPSPEAVHCEITEEAFNHVEPGSTCRGEVDVKSRIPFEPSFNLFMFMSGVVITNNMDVLSFGNVVSNQVEKANPFLVTMLLHTGADDFSTERVHRRKQRGRAISLVIMSHSLAAALLERKPWLSSVQSLDLTFLIAGEYQRVLRRVEIKADNVFELFLKMLIVGKFKTGHPMRLQTMRCPDASHGGCTDSRRFRHGSPAPMGASRRSVLNGHLYYARADRCSNRRDASWTRLVFENAWKPVLGIAAPPSPHLHNIFAQKSGNLPVLETVGGKKDYGGALFGTNRGGTSPFDDLQLLPLFQTQFDGRGYSHAQKIAELL